MARPLKLYNYARAPNPRRVRIFAADAGQSGKKSVHLLDVHSILAAEGFENQLRSA
jgi:hypothetical protein